MMQINGKIISPSDRNDKYLLPENDFYTAAWVHEWLCIDGVLILHGIGMPTLMFACSTVIISTINYY